MRSRPLERRSASDAVDARLPRPRPRASRPAPPAISRAVAQQAQLRVERRVRASACAGRRAPRRPSAGRRPRSESRAPGRASRRRCSSARSAAPRRPARGRARARRRRPLAQHVGADEAKRAVVAHDPQRHDRADPLAELVGVEPADRDHAAARGRARPRRCMLRCGRVRRARGPGATRKRSISATLDTDSPVSLTKLHSSMPSSASQSSASNGMPGPARLKRSEPARERVGGEAEPAGGAHRRADAGGVELRVVDLLVDPEGEVVVAPPRRDLLAHEQQHVAVPALLAVALGRERVVVGQQHHVRAGAPPRPGDLRHRAGAVGVGRVQVDHAGQVVHAG